MRAKRTRITHVSGGESSAPIFRGKGGSTALGAVQQRICSSPLNRTKNCAIQPAGFYGQQSSRRLIPPGPCSPSGEELPCLRGADTPVQLCQAAETTAPSLPSSPPLRGSGREPTEPHTMLGRSSNYHKILTLSGYIFMTFGLPPRECEQWGHSIQSCLRHEPHRQQPLGQAESCHIPYIFHQQRAFTPQKPSLPTLERCSSFSSTSWCSATQRCFP